MTTRFGIRFACPEDLAIAENMLVQFGDATKCDVVAGGGNDAGVVATIADRFVPAVEDAIKAANAQSNGSRAFASFKVEPAIV